MKTTGEVVLHPSLVLLNSFTLKVLDVELNNTNFAMSEVILWWGFPRAQHNLISFVRQSVLIIARLHYAPRNTSPAAIF